MHIPIRKCTLSGDLRRVEADRPGGGGGGAQPVFMQQDIQQHHLRVTGLLARDISGAGREDGQSHDRAGKDGGHH